MRVAEQNLPRAKSLVGDRDPRQRAFTVQLLSFDAPKSGVGTGVGVLLALCSAHLGKSLKGGLVTVGSLNLGGSVEDLYNVVSVAELAIENGAETLLMLVSARRQLFDLSDDMAARLNVQFYTYARDVLMKACCEC